MKAKKLTKALVVVGVIALIGITSTIAYFTGAAQSSSNVFTTGTLSVDVNQDAPLNVTGVNPGDTYQMDFSITNTGNSPIFIKGYIDGEWSNGGLSTQVVSLEQLEVVKDGSQYSLTQFGQALGTEFLVTNDDQMGMLEIPGGESIELRASVKFSDFMDNEYQGSQLSLALHLAAKQTTPGTDWPTEF